MAIFIGIDPYPIFKDPIHPGMGTLDMLNIVKAPMLPRISGRTKGMETFCRRCVLFQSCKREHVSHAGNLDRFLGRKNMLTHMLAHPYAIGGFSYAGIWAFYGLMQGLRESKSPQNHFFSWNVPYAAFFATEYFSASFIICRIRRWRCWRRGCWGRAWTVSFQCCLLPSTLSSLLAESSGLGW